MDTPLTTDTQTGTESTHRLGAMYRRAELRHRAEVGALATTKNQDVSRKDVPDLTTRPATPLAEVPQLPVVVHAAIPRTSPAVAHVAPSMRQIRTHSMRPWRLYQRMRLLRQIGVVLITAAGVTAWSLWPKTPPRTAPTTATPSSTLGTVTNETRATTGIAVPAATSPALNRLERTTARVARLAGTNADVSGRPAEELSEGRLVVSSMPAGARVTVDGVGWGATPLTIRLPPGVKRIRVTHDGYVGRERTVRISAAESSKVHLLLSRAPVRAAGR
jgi:hypothetical protein